jgi:hypothetical protein
MWTIHAKRLPGERLGWDRLRGWMQDRPAILVGYLGRTGLCTAPSQALAQVGAAISRDSYIAFTWDANGYCASLKVVNGSTLQPKNP